MAATCNEPYVPEEYRDPSNMVPLRVPAGHYFVLGDHRSASNDSRAWGPVPAGHLRQGRFRLLAAGADGDATVDVRRGRRDLPLPCHDGQSLSDAGKAAKSARIPCSAAGTSRAGNRSTVLLPRHTKSPGRRPGAERQPGTECDQQARRQQQASQEHQSLRPSEAISCYDLRSRGAIARHRRAARWRFSLDNGVGRAAATYSRNTWFRPRFMHSKLTLTAL